MNYSINIPEYEVSEFNQAFKNVIESNFDYVRIKGEISDVVGVDIEFNDPPNADLVINNTGENSVIEIARNIFKSVSKIGF